MIQDKVELGGLKIENIPDRLGDKFVHKDGSVYMIALSGHSSFTLIGLKYGGRYSDPVSDIYDVFDGDRDEFTRLGIGQTITITIGGDA